MPSTYEHQCAECGVTFIASGMGAHLRRYCDEHYVGDTSTPKVEGTVRRCQLDGCNKRIPPSKRAGTRYCNISHAQKARDQRARERDKREAKAQSLYKDPKQLGEYVKQSRQGEVYDQINNDPVMREKLISGEMTATAAAVKLDCSVAAVTRAVNAILMDIAIENQRADWRQSWRVRVMLPTEKMERLREADPASREFQKLLDELVRAYAVFSRWYFRLEGKRPLIKEFHLRWIRSILVAWATGGKQLILSPPRHGKSEMLVRFVVWWICMDPNIRIGWFCASRDVAELMLGAVKDYLTNSEQLINDVLPPGELFDPGLKSGKPWSKKELKVAQCNHIGQKSSTLLALGLTSKFLSRDMDIIVIDDPEDFDSTQEEAQRKKARNKLAEIGTRKEEHTAMCFISSRQHPDDIPAHLLALEGTRQSWNTIVDSAHAADCGLEPDNPETYHLHQECMLFPEVRSYRWLMEKKEEMEVLGVPHAFSMRYLNHPIPEDGQVFDVPLIRDTALNRNRGLGLDGLPLGHLAAGLDPSARGIQAAYLWHYREADKTEQEHGLSVKMSMVDLDATRAGGVQGAIDIICDWFFSYGVTLWFYETNSQQLEFYKLVKDGVEKRMQAKLGHNPIVIKEHSTGQNKKDAELGISAMAPLYHNGSVDLPYGTNEARVKVNMLLRQLELWTSDGVQSRKALTDIKMAQWFPFVGRIQSFLKNAKKPKLAEAVESSYPDMGYEEAPWASMYPGG